METQNPAPSASEADSTVEPTLEPAIESAVESEAAPTTEPKPSYVKLAMRNMVRKRGISLQHFALTTIGLLSLLVGLAYLTR